MTNSGTTCDFKSRKMFRVRHNEKFDEEKKTHSVRNLLVNMISFWTWHVLAYAISARAYTKSYTFIVLFFCLSLLIPLLHRQLAIFFFHHSNGLRVLQMSTFFFQFERKTGEAKKKEWRLQHNREKKNRIRKSE